ncbi:MAG: GNAT family N-acetyltransferase [Prosthecobacter sp.]|uniref:GNAT family N-acetyltransferase n=1 Tax=Prosthecobacter sp. TaxID=1965333 RepID=UPI0039008CB9
MIASPNILTPHGEHPVRIEFGGPHDDVATRRWRAPGKHSMPHLAADAIEFARLAGKRWRYYLKRGEAVGSIGELRAKITAQPQGEFGFLLVARPTWKPAPSALGIAWCRRTWCNHVVLDFLSVHPATNDPAGGYKGMGGAMLRAVAVAAGMIGCPLVWGEATVSSATFYEKMLGGKKIQDHFFFDEAALTALRAALQSPIPSKRRLKP